MQLKELFEETNVVSFEKKKLEKQSKEAFKNAGSALNYLKHALSVYEHEQLTIEEFGDILKKVEDFIAPNPQIAYLYAKELMPRIYHVKGKRFVKAERFIARNPDIAYNYSMNILKSPWFAASPNRVPLEIARIAEYTIAADPYISYNYALNLIGGPWGAPIHPEIVKRAENSIYGEPAVSSHYEKFVKSGKR
jgi:hypothetical protein